MLAREHGAEPRARAIREEFDLREPAETLRLLATSSAGARAEANARRHLEAVLRIARAPTPELRPEQQASAILDELLRAVDAERGLVWYEPDRATGPRLLVGRDRRGADRSEAEAWREPLMRRVLESAEPWPAAGPRDGGDGDGGEGADRERVLVLPLSLYDRAVGAVCVERGRSAPAFGEGERDLLALLAAQAPLSLEIARALAEREQLQSTLQQAQKMEAVGQLAGGIAHDIHNMLGLVSTSLEAMARADLGETMAQEVRVVTEATERAGRLMRQLLGFARQQSGATTPCVVNDAITHLHPMLRRLAGERVNVVLKLDPNAYRVVMGRASFDQAIVNLVLNARDAMPQGGTVSIQTRNTVLDRPAARGALRAGEYLAIEISDTGGGISPENVPRVFDPFFTTKPQGRGTGIGLTTAYSFVRNCGGNIEVSSELGHGTTFRIYLPNADEERRERGRADSVLTV
jgi:signal transduction histidine kinase